MHLTIYKLRVHAIYTLLLKQNVVINWIAFNAMLSQEMTQCENERTFILAFSIVAHVFYAQKKTWTTILCEGSFFDT